MSFQICQKHGKVERIPSKVSTTAYVCMNRYCPDSFKIFCSACKNDHRDHSIKILTLQDLSFLVDRLLKTPFKQLSGYVGQSLDVMKKLKLIKQFRKKIDVLEKQIQKQAMKLVDITQSLIHQYAICKESVGKLADILDVVTQPQNYSQLVAHSQELLSNLDYNFKKDKMQFGNSITKQKQDRRRKSSDNTKRKIQEVRDYSMKIIQVILHNDDTDEQQQDFAYRKKHYEMLKQELQLLQKSEQQLDQQLSQMKNSNSTENKSLERRLLMDMEIQTHSQIMSKQEMEERVMELKECHVKMENDLRLKLSVLAREKENLNREIGRWKDKEEEKKKIILGMEIKLRQNREARVLQQKVKEQLFDKIMELSQWRGLSQIDKFD